MSVLQSSIWYPYAEEACRKEEIDPLEKNEVYLLRTTTMVVMGSKSYSITRELTTFTISIRVSQELANWEQKW